MQKALHEIMANRFGEDWLQKARTQQAINKGEVKQSEFDRCIEQFGIPPLKKKNCSPTISPQKIKEELK